MPTIKVRELEEYETDLALRKAEQKYRNYCTIRRNLRDAYFFVNSAIAMHEEIKADPTQLSGYNSMLKFYSAAVMHAVVLYCRWFGATNGKPTLDVSNYFRSSKHMIGFHERLMEIRHKYVVHHEDDILGGGNDKMGGDIVSALFDENGLFLRSESTFKEQLWLTLDEMKAFRECICIVHNELDARIIPREQRKLDRALTRIFGRSGAFGPDHNVQAGGEQQPE